MLRLKEINSPGEIPKFRDEAEESEFWATHSLGEGMLERMGPVPEGELPPSRPRTRPVAVRVESLEEIPEFQSEAEEADWWATHRLGESLLEEMGPLPDSVLPRPRPRTRPVAVRLDEDVLRRLRQLAERKHKGYQTLLKEFVMERLYEEEKREGLVGERAR